MKRIIALVLVFVFATTVLVSCKKQEAVDKIKDPTTTTIATTTTTVAPTTTTVAPTTTTVALTTTATAQAPTTTKPITWSELLGSWKSSGGEYGSVVITFTANEFTMTFDGAESITNAYTVQGGKIIVKYESETLEMGYTVSGNTLTLTIDGVQEVYTKI